MKLGTEDRPLKREKRGKPRAIGEKDREGVFCGCLYFVCILFVFCLLKQTLFSMSFEVIEVFCVLLIFIAGFPRSGGVR